MISWPKPNEYGYDINGFKKSRQNILINQLLKQSDQTQSKIKTWNKFLVSGRDQINESQLKQMVRDGIPDRMRNNIWPKLIKDRFQDYTTILQRPGDQKYLKNINLDIKRTFPNNIFFTQNQFCCEGLKNVLKALSNIYPQVGYCQGLNYIVATLLLRVSEQDAFHITSHILRNLGHGKLLINLKNIESDLFVLDCLVQKHFKKFHQHLAKFDLKSIEYASSWFITLYCGCLPFQTNLRILQLYLAQGKKILFRVALAILKLKKHKAKEMNTFEDTLMFLKNYDDFRNIPASDFVKLMFQFNISRKEIEGYQEIFKARK